MAAKSEEAKTWVGNVLCCFLLLSVSMMIADQDRNGSSHDQNLEIQKLLKKLNRPTVKSIKSPDGDIIDCVHISNQPAFTDPKFENHKIQMRPSFHPEKSMLEKSEVSAESQPISQLWQQSGSCPEETIPIRRIRKEDILRAKSIQQFGNKNLQHRSFETQTKHQFAAVYVKGDKYYGGMATMNVWNPHVQEHNEFSDSQISILNDDIGKGYNSIQAGWQVNPRLYGDNNTRFFTFWRGGSGQDITGCYDILCSGFIQVSHEVVLGAAIKPLSAYGDSKSQHAITILVWKDQKDGNWWLQYGPKEVVGYWPASLFPLLSKSATTVGWGGEVLNLGSNGQHTTTQMGSGHFPQEGYGKACFFWNIKVINGNNQTVPPNNIHTRIDQPNCYNIQTGQSNDWGNYFSFGGPGRNPSCL